MSNSPTEALNEAPSGLQDALRAELRLCLTRAGLRQIDAAQKLGLSQKHLSRMLNGRVPLPPHWAERIALACDRELVISSEPCNKDLQGRPMTFAEAQDALLVMICHNQELFNVLAGPKNPVRLAWATLLADETDFTYQETVQAIKNLTLKQRDLHISDVVNEVRVMRALAT